MKYRVIAEFVDLEAGARRLPGETIEVSEQRATVLHARGVILASAIPQQSPAPGDTASGTADAGESVTGSVAGDTTGGLPDDVVKLEIPSEASLHDLRKPELVQLASSLSIETRGKTVAQLIEAIQAAGEVK